MLSANLVFYWNYAKNFVFSCIRELESKLRYLQKTSFFHAIFSRTFKSWQCVGLPNIVSSHIHCRMSSISDSWPLNDTLTDFQIRLQLKTAHVKCQPQSLANGVLSLGQQKTVTFLLYTIRILDKVFFYKMLHIKSSYMVRNSRMNYLCS